MEKWMAVLSLLTISSTSFAAPVTACKEEIINAAEISIDLKVQAYKIPGYNMTTKKDVYLDGNLDYSSMELVSSTTKGLTATIDASDIGSRYKIEVKVGSRCDLQSVVIHDLGQR